LASISALSFPLSRRNQLFGEADDEQDRRPQLQKSFGQMNEGRGCDEGGNKVNPWRPMRFQSGYGCPIQESVCVTIIISANFQANDLSAIGAEGLTFSKSLRRLARRQTTTVTQYVLYGSGGRQLEDSHPSGCNLIRLSDPLRILPIHAVSPSLLLPQR
jgi:hypothetical protein